MLNGVADAVSVAELAVNFGSSVEIGDVRATVTAELFGGHLALEVADAAPVIGLLEPVLVLRAESCRRLAAVLGLMDGESAVDRDAASPVLGRLVEVMLMQAMRSAGLQSRKGAKGLAAGLRDRVVGVALRSMHERPAAPWTISGLAAVAGMSRSQFAARFERLVGLPPAT